MIEGAYLETARGQIHLRTAGEGPALVLLAPSPRSSRYYTSLMPRLTGHRCLALDTPGFGGSSALPAEWTMEAIADLLAEALQCGEVDRADVIGIHTGNKIGTALASRHPGLVASLTIVGMSHSLVLDDADRATAYSAYSPSPETVAAATGGAGADRWLTGLTDVTAAVRRAAQLASSGALDRLHAVGDYIEDVLTGLDCYEPLYRANYAYRWPEALATVRCRTSIIELVTQQEAELAGQAAALADLITDAEIVTIEGSDRRLMTYEPHRLAAPLLDFLERTHPHERTSA